MEHAEAAEAVRQFTARGLPEATGFEGTSEAMIRSLDPDPVAMAERRERHGEAWATVLNAAAEEKSP